MSIQNEKILETERLFLREFNYNDADFIIQLVNSPDWLEFIGDKGVKTANDAKNYIENTLLESYKNHGYGLWMVVLNDSKIPIGMCGLVNRESLDDIDIGFAILPTYMKSGYGYEIAKATLRYANVHLGIPKIVAITDPNNNASIKLLNKLGLYVERTVQLSKNDNVLLLSQTSIKNEKTNE